MQDIIGNYIQKFLNDHRKKKKFISIFVLLALLVSTGVFWKMKLTGISMSADVLCGKEEHQHDESCWEKVLVCGLEESEPQEVVVTPEHTHTEECYEYSEKIICEVAEHQHGEECYNEEGELICELPEHQHSDACYITEKSLICGKEETKAVVETKPGHVHTEECYEEKLVCEKEEHTHTIACMCDINADVETAADWEATLPALKGEWAEDFIAVAKSQLGYRESTRNFELSEDGEKTKGYSRYGAWYGNAYGDWCAMFVSWCLNYAEIPKEAVPYAAGCYAWTVELEKMGLYQPAGDYVPQTGDIIFFDGSGTGKSDHVGIVESVDVESAVIHTIEGNSSDKVKENKYKMSDDYILGYGNLKKAETQYVLQYGGEFPEITLTAEIYTDDTFEEPINTDETIITVTGSLPEGAVVKAYPVEIQLENQLVIASYDISVFLEDGTVYEPEEGKTLEVRFALAQQEEQLSVYYVPDTEEEPEKIESSIEDEEIIFQAEHFSVYAVTKEIDGDTVSVKTDAEFKSAFAQNNIIVQLDDNITFDTGAENVSDNGIELNNQNIALDLNGYVLTVSGYNPLFTVGVNSELTIIDSKEAEESNDTFTYAVTETSVINRSIGATQENLVQHNVPINGYIDANASTVVSLSGGTVNMESGILRNGTNRAFDISAGTVNLQGGYILGFSKAGSAASGDANFGGAILATGGNINLSGTVLAANSALNGGAIYAKGNTAIEMTIGVISGNHSVRAGGWDDHSEKAQYRCGGGGIFLNGNAQFTMSGGYITNNEVQDTGYFDGGGGVNISGNSSMILNNGYITGNKAQGGGGIRTDFGKNASFIMNGGFISGNIATTAEGAGATIDRDGIGSFECGYITNNRILETEHWGGGGLFCADGSSLYLKKALITENDAGGFGGGVAGCPTGKIYLYIDDGCAIYNNDDVVDGTIHFVKGGSKDQIDTQRCDAFFQSHGHKDYFCALNSTVTGTMLGNNPANWEGSADGTAVSLGANDAQTATSVMGLQAHPTEEGIAAAQGNAAVYINGNYSYTHGGGILCNGNLIIGNPTDIEVPARLAVKAKKVFKDADGNNTTDLSDYNFRFQMLDENQQVIGDAVADADGTINFENLVFDKEGTYTYIIKEIVDASKPSIIYDTAEYRLTVKVQENVTTLYEATKTAYLITNTKVEKSDGNGGWTIVSDTDYGVGKDNLALQLTGDRDSFINAAVSVSKITVIKKWADNIVGADYVTVVLYRNEEIYATVKLDASNNWTYTWTDLPPGHSYRVEELEMKGYTASYTTENFQGEQSGYWVPASSLTAGQQYMIVSSDGKKALYVSPNHQNAGFDNSDTKEVTKRTGTLTVGSNTYSDWYDAEGIDARCIFTAQESSRNNNKGIILKNNGASAGTWLLVQNANNNYLKGTSGNNYASFMAFENGLLKGQDGYNWNPNNLRTVIFSNNRFNTSANTTNAAKLYTLVSSNLSEDSIITITNTPKEEDEEYNLPATGGIGTFWYYLGGFLLVLVSFLYRLNVLRKR